MIILYTFSSYYVIRVYRFAVELLLGLGEPWALQFCTAPRLLLIATFAIIDVIR